MLGLLAWGCGLLVERVGGVRVADGLLLPLGFATMIVIGTAVASVTGLRPTGSALVVVLAAVGLVVSRGRVGPPERWLAGAVVVVFAIFAAPVLLSGQATFAGYTRLDDASTFLALTARLIDRGRDVSGLAPSTYARTIAAYLGTGYPIGSLAPLATVQPLVGANLAWIFQPYLTVLASLLAMCLWSLAGPLGGPAGVRAAIVVIASQPALLYAYANEEGGVKELAMAMLVALAAALTAPLVRREISRGTLLFAAIAGVAMFDTYSVGAGPWLGPLGVIVILSWGAAVADPARRRLVGRAALAGVAVVLAVLLASLGAIGSFTKAAGDLGASSMDLGNLYRPLSTLQILGVWPVGDFRTRLSSGAGVAGVLIAAVAAMAVLGARHLLRERAWSPLLYGAAGLVGFLVVDVAGGAWVTAKAMAIVSPAALLLAAAGVVWWSREGARVLAGAVACAIGAGVLWSNGLAYHDVALAPRDRLSELAQIGRDFSGEGPALLNEYEPYGARLFLRSLDAEAPSELRARPVYLRDGTYLQKAQVATLDQFALKSLLVYRTIIVRRSPQESRPPAPFALRRAYRYYEVWQQQRRPPAVISDLVLRTGIDPAGVAGCGAVASLARTAAAAGAQLVAAPGDALVASALGASTHPPSWSVDGGAQHLTPTSPGDARLELTIPRTATYSAWIGGSFGRGVSLSVDGRPLATVRDELSFPDQYGLFGQVTLAAGPHEFILRYPGGSLRPGTAQVALPLGPLVLRVDAAQPSALISVAPAQASSLCGRRLQWIEAVRSGP